MFRNAFRKGTDGDKATQDVEDGLPLSREDVTSGFRWVLGREPENDDVIQHHRHIPTWRDLRQALLESEEFVRTNKFLRFDEKWILTSVYSGHFHMWVDLHDRYVSYGCLQDDYEASETDFIRKNVKPGDVALDVGANVGWHTLGLALAVGEAGHVHAFEPRTTIHAHLERTLAVNDLTHRVSLRPFGLWDTPSELSLAWQPGGDNPGGSHVVTDNDPAAQQKIVLKTIDGLIDGRVDFIKIDIEGAEPKALRGGIELLKKNRPIILSELHPAQLARVSGYTPAQFLAEMAGIGYVCRALDGPARGQQLHDFVAPPGIDIINVVFSAPDRAIHF